MKLKKGKICGKYVFYYLPNDKYVGQRIALNKYEPYETDLIQRQVKKGNVVVDVGANIGYYTILLANKVGKNGKVYAFEPDSINFEILEKNIKANSLKNVVAIKAAVGNKNGTKILYKSKENFGDHKLYETPLGSAASPLDKGEKIKIIKLDNFIKEKVDLMKIDTQGWEPEVIEGSKNLIKKYLPTIFFEYSPLSYKMAKLDGEKMIKWLKNIYKKIFWIDDWMYIYKSLDKKKIEQICSSSKTGYADLFVKKDLSFFDYIDQYKNIRVKKLVKKIIGYNRI